MIFDTARLAKMSHDIFYLCMRERKKTSAHDERDKPVFLVFYFDEIFTPIVLKISLLVEQPNVKLNYFPTEVKINVSKSVYFSHQFEKN